MSTGTKSSAARPKVNFVAFLAGALSIVSTFLPWWGIEYTGLGGVPQSYQWSLWSGPSYLVFNPNISPQTFTIAGPIVGVLVISSAVLAFVSAIPKASDLLILSAILSVVALVSYVAIISQAVTTACTGVPSCINGSFGSMVARFFSITWGYQIGFYLAIVTAVIGSVGVWFQRTFLTVKSSTTKLAIER